MEKINFLKPWRHTYGKFILAGLAVRLLAALFNEGIFHADEHYQILEYINLKLFNSPVSDLTWEYEARLRPWFHPWVYLNIIKFFQLFGIEDRFFYVTVFRVISAVFGFYSTLCLCQLSLDTFNKTWQKKWSIILLNLAWFYPFLHARTSAEGLGTSLFIIAMYLFLTINDKKKRNLILVGIIFGISFLIRYHIAFMVTFLCLWSLVYKKKSIFQLSLITVSTFVVIGLGVLIDFWGYGEWVFAPWNYFDLNILKGVAASHKTDPWWFYLYAAQKFMFPGVGAFIVLSGIIYWMKNLKSPLTWISLGFFAIHCYISHKEFRYIFSLAPFLPLMVIFTIGWLREKWPKLQKLKPALTFIWILNFIPLSYATFRPIGHYIAYFKFLTENNYSGMYYVNGAPPTYIIEIPMSYYTPSNFHAKKVNNFAEIKDQSFLYHTSFGNEYIEMQNKKSCEEIYPKYSQIKRWFYFGKKASKTKVWALYRCKKDSNDSVN